MIKWPILQLGKVIQQRKEFVFIDDFTEYKRCRVQLHAQGIVLRDTVSGAEIKTKKQQVCRAREFLVAEIDAKVGGFGVVPDDLDGAIVSSHYFLFEVDEEKLDRKFLDYFVRTPGFQDQVSAQGSTNYAAIRPNDVLGYQIPLPPLPEQRRIVARIEELAAKINEARGLRQQTAETAEALWERGASTILNTVGSHYRRERLADLVTMRGGGTPSKANPYYWDGRIPWVTPKDMKVRGISDSIDHISEHAIRETTAKLIEPGAVLVVVRGMILAHTFPSAVLRVPAAINQDMKALIPNNKILPEFLCAFLWATNAATLDLVEKSTHDTRKLETETLLVISVPVPPISDQSRIIEQLDVMQARVENLKKLQTETAAELDALLPSILDKAFKGEL
jgi:type I restriction enzyme S subunit